MLDIILILIIVIMALIGLNSGFVKSVFNLGYFIISAIFAAVLYPVVSTLLINTRLAGFLRDRASKWLLENGSSAIDKLPDFMKTLINPEMQTATDALATSVTQTLLNIISILIVFLLVRFGLKFAVKFLNIIASVPVLSRFNSAGGLIIGILNGFIIVYVLLAAATFFVSSDIMDLIMKSPITDSMYNNNLLLRLIFR